MPSIGGEQERFHDTASESLLNVVEEMNEIDVSGPMEVRVVEFVNGWQLIDSLSTGSSHCTLLHWLLLPFALRI